MILAENLSCLFVFGVFERCSSGPCEGMQLNNKLLQLIALRFADDNYDIDFDDYLTCIVRLENMFSA